LQDMKRLEPLKLAWEMVSDEEFEAAAEKKNPRGRPRTSPLAEILEAAVAGRKSRIRCKSRDEVQRVLNNLAARRSRVCLQAVFFAEGLTIYVGPGEYKPKPKTPKAKKG